MSLRPDDKHRRSRSKSPGRARSRSRCSYVPPAQHYAAAAESGNAAPKHTVRQPYAQHESSSSSEEEEITMGGYADLPPEERPGYVPPQGVSHAGPYTQSATAGSRAGVTYAQPGAVQYSTTPASFAYTAAPASQYGRTAPPANSGPYQYGSTDSKITYTAKPVGATARPPPAVRRTSQTKKLQPTQQPMYTATPATAAMPHAPAPPPAGHYVAAPPPPPPPMGVHSPGPGPHRSLSSAAGTTSDGRRVVEMVPGGGGGGGGGGGKLNAPPSPAMRPHSLSVSGARPDGLTNRMDRLSVSGSRPDIHTIVPGGMPGGMPGGLPPPSPMMEAYHGTYQSISPMPHAMMLDDDLDHLEPLDSLSPRASGHLGHGGNGTSRHRRGHSIGRSPSPNPHGGHRDKLAMEAAYGGERDHYDPRDRHDSRDRHDRHDRHDPRDRHEPRKTVGKAERRVRVYDAEDDALALVDAMSGRTVDADTIIDILPALSHDQMLELRNEYKRHCKVQGRGINIAKHIKLKTTGNFGKIAYVTALGRYEGEGYWANYWYQSNSAKRELLIEALMGRQNYEIREIKDAFKDKRYSDSLTRCMDKELKADKFRKAVLMALEGERQEESDQWPIEYRNRDVDTLYKAIHAREGGESTMLGVVIMRSDAHLREVLRTYERKYQGSFARDALRKSNNLVGEVIAHILNGVINRPARDAMLLHHALMDLIDPAPSSDKKKDSANSKHERQQRHELLISRLVRLHWERMHLQKVKMEYEDKYGRVVEEDIEEATKGDFREFCIALCQSGN